MSLTVMSMQVHHDSCFEEMFLVCAWTVDCTSTLIEVGAFDCGRASLWASLFSSAFGELSEDVGLGETFRATEPTVCLTGRYPRRAAN